MITSRRSFFTTRRRIITLSLRRWSLTFLSRLTSRSSWVIRTIFFILSSTRRYYFTRRFIFTTRRRIITLSLRRWSLTFLSTTLRTTRCIRIIATILILYYSILWWRRRNTRASRVIRIFITIISCKICKCICLFFKFSSLLFVTPEPNICWCNSRWNRFTIYWSKDISLRSSLTSNWLNKT